MSPATPSQWSHAGGVVVRATDGELQFLLVEAKDRDIWVLPKGHIEPGETPEAAAMRSHGRGRRAPRSSHPREKANSTSTAGPCGPFFLMECEGETDRTRNAAAHGADTKTRSRSSTSTTPGVSS